MTTGSPDWRVDIEMPDDGWIDVPAAQESVAGWAEDVCRDLYVEGPDAVALAEQLRVFGVASRDRASDVMLLWLPSPEHGVLATLTLDAYGPGELEIGGPLPRPLGLDGIHAAEASIREPGVAPPRLSTVELPAGPAVRCRRLELVDADTGAGTFLESVAHTVVPVQAPGARLPDAVRVVVSWSLLEEGDDLAELADDCARGVRITPG